MVQATRTRATRPARPTAGAPAKGKKGGKLEQLGASDVDFLDPGQTYYTGGFQVLYATQTPLYSSKPGDRRRRAGPRRGQAGDLRRQEVGHGEAQEGHQVRSAGRTARSRRRTSSTPSSARSPRTSRTSTRPTSTSSRARRRSRRDSMKDISGHRDRPGRSVQDHVQAHEGAGAGLRRLPRDAGHDAGPAGVRGEVRQEGAVDVQRERRRPAARTWSRTTPRASSSGYKAGKSIELVRNPNWDASKDFRPAYLDEILLRTNATDANVSGRQVLQGESLVLDTNPPAQVLKRVVQRQKDQLVTLPGGGFRWFPLNHDDQAARRHQRPQGDPGGVRPRGRHQGARRLVRRQAGHALHPAGHRRVRRGRRRQGARASTSWPTRRATWPWPRST